MLTVPGAILGFMELWSLVSGSELSQARVPVLCFTFAVLFFSVSPGSLSSEPRSPSILHHILALFLRSLPLSFFTFIYKVRNSPRSMPSIARYRWRWRIWLRLSISSLPTGTEDSSDLRSGLFESRSRGAGRLVR